VPCSLRTELFGEVLAVDAGILWSLPGFAW
jgi:hypothetical protein